MRKEKQHQKGKNLKKEAFQNFSFGTGSKETEFSENPFRRIPGRAFRGRYIRLPELPETAGKCKN
ncbi:MAG: hypothetical protein LBP81_02530 [Treponema sp.]|jgi:hypothetical protein|nr:hypothetical protein [Treponema sp.]